MDDLTGTSDERTRKLAELEADGPLPPEWVRRQLTLVLEAWGAEEALEAEANEDF